MMGRCRHLYSVKGLSAQSLSTFKKRSGKEARGSESREASQSTEVE